MDKYGIIMKGYRERGKKMSISKIISEVKKGLHETGEIITKKQEAFSSLDENINVICNFSNVKRDLLIHVEIFTLTEINWNNTCLYKIIR